MWKCAFLSLFICVLYAYSQRLCFCFSITFEIFILYDSHWTSALRARLWKNAWFHRAIDFFLCFLLTRRAIPTQTVYGLPKYHLEGVVPCAVWVLYTIYRHHCNSKNLAVEWKIITRQSEIKYKMKNCNTKNRQQNENNTITNQLVKVFRLQRFVGAITYFFHSVDYFMLAFISPSHYVFSYLLWFET